MKIFLSAIEGNEKIVRRILKEKDKLHYNLMSYYYIQQKKNSTLAEEIRDRSELIMIDSGAHSFQKGKKVNWDKYTEQYAKFIKEFDRPNVVGYFEMDVDNIIGYEKVKELRKVLEQVSDKIIPVWHKNRGLAEFKKMCQDYSGKVIAITGFKNEDIKDEQYYMFLDYAHKHNCRVHCLGMTRKKILNEVPFDYVDSSSWLQYSVYGQIDNKRVPKALSKADRESIIVSNYLLGMKKQEHYYNKWKRVNKD